jgi:hypothetical protein
MTFLKKLSQSWSLFKSFSPLTGPFTHKSPKLVLTLNQINLVNNLKSYIIKIQYDTTSIYGIPGGLFRSDFPTKNLHEFLVSPVRTTGTGHHILTDFISQIIFYEKYKLQRS